MHASLVTYEENSCITVVTVQRSFVWAAPLCSFQIWTLRQTENFIDIKWVWPLVPFAFYSSDGLRSLSLARCQKQHTNTTWSSQTAACPGLLYHLWWVTNCDGTTGGGKNREHALPYSSEQRAVGGRFRSASTEGAAVWGRWLWIFILSTSLQDPALLLWPLLSGSLSVQTQTPHRVSTQLQQWKCEKSLFYLPDFLDFVALILFIYFFS